MCIAADITNLFQSFFRQPYLMFFFLEELFLILLYINSYNTLYTTWRSLVAMFRPQKSALYQALQHCIIDHLKFHILVHCTWFNSASQDGFDATKMDKGHARFQRFLTEERAAGFDGEKKDGRFLRTKGWQVHSLHWLQIKWIVGNHSVKLQPLLCWSTPFSFLVSL